MILNQAITMLGRSERGSLEADTPTLNGSITQSTSVSEERVGGCKIPGKWHLNLAQIPH